MLLLLLLPSGRQKPTRGSRCHVSAKLGPGWNYEYRVKWEMLPVIISRALHAQMAKYGMPPRLVEVGLGSCRGWVFIGREHVAGCLAQSCATTGGSLPPTAGYFVSWFIH